MSTVTFTPPDSSFATASGSNIGAQDGLSYFDDPPSSSTNLSISSNAGDPDPYTFEPGETYDISWSGDGGGQIEDATVIRSDDWGGEQGIVVFEGTNSITGELFQIVWTPNFDLQQWYDNSGAGPGQPAGFYTSDRSSSSYAASTCFAFGTLIDCADGLRRIESLRGGDMVLTVDRGAVPIKWMSFSTQCLRSARVDQQPVRINAQALGPDHPVVDLTVSAQHRILVGGHGQLAHLFPEPVFVPAKALTSLPGIAHVAPFDRIQWAHIALGHHDIIRANGAFSESMLLGKMALSAIPLLQRMHVWSLFRVPENGPTPINGPCARPTLRVGEAVRQLRAMSNQPDGAPLRWHIDLKRLQRRAPPKPALKRPVDARASA
ncbi:Hint domain-containing protein [Gymnodinialimonas sp.]